MAYLLHIESATKVCSVALSKNGQLVQLQESKDEQYSHGEKLSLFVLEVFKKEGIEAKDLGAISLSSGPGSYTGLRIGVSLAKGMCYALQIPLIAIDSLLALYEGTKDAYPETIIIPMIDARRMEVFCSVYKNDELLRPIKAEILEENSFTEFEPFVVCGDACAKVAPFWSERSLIFAEEIYSSAAHQVKKAWEKYQLKSFEDTAYFEPFYLKDFVSK